MIRLTLADAEATARLGAALATLVASHKGLVIHLLGELGAGKTTLARGLLRALGVAGTIRSPTYTLLEPYELPGHSLIHLDLYRLNDPNDLEQLGLRDYPAGQIAWLVEWPQRGSGHLPKPDVEAQLMHQGSLRLAQVESIYSDELQQACKMLL